MPVNHQPPGSANRYTVPELDDAANAPDAFIAFANSVDALIGIPVGTILPYAGASAPTGWFLCNGAEVSAATNPKLAALLGTNFGAASSGMVKLPDFRGRFPIGTESGQSWALGARGGSAQVTLTASNLPQHTHTVSHSHSGATASATDTHSHDGGNLTAAAAGAFTRTWNISTGTNGVSSVETFAKVDVARDGGNRTPITLNLSIPTHTHAVTGSTGPGGSAHAHTFDIPASTATTDGGNGGGSAVNVIPPYLAVGFIIKAG